MTQDVQPPLPPSLFDAYAPAQIAKRVQTVGVAKAHMPLLPMAVLGLLAGAFIAFGGMASTLAMTGSTLGFGITRLIGGAAFSLGLILVIVAGAELFTGNNLLIMAWVQRLISTRDLLRNWAIVYAANLAGSLGAALLVHWSGSLGLGGNEVAVTAARTAAAKIALDPWPALIRGVLCNALVCLAVWLCFAAHSVTDKILAIVPPIAAFVALGFEHSVANMYLIPIGILAAGDPAVAQAAGIGPGGLNWLGFLHNLLPVTAGNMIGGAVFVGMVYYICYLRGAES